eukprot:10247405-Alexandrium_andersonii.AAC.1
MRHKIAAAVLSLHGGLGWAEAQRMVEGGDGIVDRERLRLCGRVPWRGVWMAAAEAPAEEPEPGPAEPAI